MPWKTFIDLPSSAIRAAKRCALLHCSVPAPTRHECQTASEVHFISLTLIRSSFQYFLLMSTNMLTAQFLSHSLTDLCYCRSVESFEVKWFPRGLSAQQLQRWKCHPWSGRGRSPLLTPNEIWCSLDNHPSLNIGSLFIHQKTRQTAHIYILYCGDCDVDVSFAWEVFFPSLRDTVCILSVLLGQCAALPICCLQLSSTFLLCLTYGLWWICNSKVHTV